MIPLHLAANFKSSVAVLNALIEAGADIDALDSVHRSPLHYASIVEFKSSTTVVSTLVQAGANLDALDSAQNSPLHLASRWNLAVVPVLIGAGCKVNLLNKYQESPLFCAALSKDRSAVAALMAAAADPHLGLSPLTDSDVSDEMKHYIRSLSK